VTFNEGHHIVFQRQQIVRAHSQAIILSDGGRLGGRKCGKFASAAAL
jgi:hypothetical protein